MAARDTWPTDLVREARSALEEIAGPVEGNAREQAGGQPVLFDAVRDMAVFDRLPSRARAALNYAPDCYSAAQVLLLAVDQDVPPSRFGDALARRLGR